GAVGVGAAVRGGGLTVGWEGQLAVGALASTTVTLAFAALPRPLLLAAGALAGAVGGAMWALPPALLRGYARVNEVLSTLMLNYVAGLGLRWRPRTPPRGPGPTAPPAARRPAR